MLTRSLPAKWARIIAPDSIWTRKTALGNVSTTTPSSSIVFFCGVDFPKSCGAVEIVVKFTFLKSGPENLRYEAFLGDCPTYSLKNKGGGEMPKDINKVRP